MIKKLKNKLVSLNKKKVKSKKDKPKNKRIQKQIKIKQMIRKDQKI